jgi:GNAT superfamily N-acetyltransferase
VWSVVCFYVDARARRKRVATALLEAAVDHAIRHGATIVEAYPHRDSDYMGSPSLYLAAGFEPVRQAGPRTVMRYDAAR